MILDISFKKNKFLSFCSLARELLLFAYTRLKMTCETLNLCTTQNSEKFRLCRTCSRYLPIELFPRGPVRYICKTHWTAQIYECTQKKLKRLRDEQEDDTYNAMKIENFLNSSSSDEEYKNQVSNKTNLIVRSSKSSFKRKKQSLSKLRSISILVDSKDDAKKVFQVGKVEIGIKDVERLVGSDLSFRLIPADPLIALGNSNIIICTKRQRTELTSLWKSRKDVNAYKQMLELFALKVQPTYIEPFHEWY